MKERDHLLAKGGILAGRQRRNPPFYQQTQKGMDDDGRVLRSGEGGCLQGEGKACPQGRFSAFFVKAQEIDDEKRVVSLAKVLQFHWETKLNKKLHRDSRRKANPSKWKRWRLKIFSSRPISDNGNEMGEKKKKLVI